MSTIVLRRQPRRPELFAPLALSTSSAGPWAPALRVPAAPAVSWERDGQDGVLAVEAPGLDAQRDLSVQLTGSTLTVSGTRREISGRSRREARFSRSVTLPEGVGTEAVTAAYQAGVLRVRVAGMFPTPVTPQTVTVTIVSDVPTTVEATAPAAPADETPTDQATADQAGPQAA